MYKNKTFLAIVPARGGSKRLPKKNILVLAGKPLLVWSVEAGLKSNYIDKVVVTSDDDNILNISTQVGAEIFKRSDLLSSDKATTFSVVENVIANFEPFDYVVLLQPTSPLRTSFQLDESIELLEKRKADAIVSVCEMEHSPLWSNTLDELGDMTSFIKDDIKNNRSQDLDTYYRLNGAIYICDTKRLLIEKTFFLKKNIFAYRMSRETSIDIDEQIDFDLAKALLV